MLPEDGMSTEKRENGERESKAFGHACYFVSF